MKVMQVYFDTSMSLGHPGLYKRAGEFKGYVVFINKKWTALKMLTPHNVLLHYKSPANRPIVPETISMLPHCVEGGKLDYERALGAVVQKQWDKRFGE